ncbi:hypothetical protein EVAR_43645_1 [Eumeta japonica]|uniref:Uncharacterized protein n=1 Tax=Eumeta variegata TaxID=151549 RepID=A0A4C1ZKM2_EUMVA|nr:hypothetical protein EVAR_43645_1 [Eumeta japonica]
MTPWAGSRLTTGTETEHVLSGPRLCGSPDSMAGSSFGLRVVLEPDLKALKAELDFDAHRVTLYINLKDEETHYVSRKAKSGAES